MLDFPENSHAIHGLALQSSSFLLIAAVMDALNLEAVVMQRPSGLHFAVMARHMNQIDSGSFYCALPMAICWPWTDRLLFEPFQLRAHVDAMRPDRVQ